MISFFLFAVSLAFSKATHPGQTATPPSIHIDKGACPFECCTYREWTARTDATLVESPNSKKVVGHIKKGQKILALTGEVHSRPLRVVVRNGYPEIGVKPGEAIYILHYMGEGYWKIWHGGKEDEIQDYPGGGSAKPKTTWWIKLKSSSGVVGWTVEHGNFDNQDACG